MNKEFVVLVRQNHVFETEVNVFAKNAKQAKAKALAHAATLEPDDDSWDLVEIEDAKVGRTLDTGRA